MRELKVSFCSGNLLGTILGGDVALVVGLEVAAVGDLGFFVVVDVFLVVGLFVDAFVVSTVTSSESDFFRAYLGGGPLLKKTI